MGRKALPQLPEIEQAGGSFQTPPQLLHKQERRNKPEKAQGEMVLEGLIPWDRPVFLEYNVNHMAVSSKHPASKARLKLRRIPDTALLPLVPSCHRIFQ
jgi:hypothetical protein